MAARKLQIKDAFHFGRKNMLRPGDRFRVTGGPIYVTDDGAKIPMYERGVLVFERYCVQGSAKWIEGHRADGGHVVLWVGKPCWSKTISGLRRRPYRITRKLDKKTGSQTRAKKPHR